MKIKINKNGDVIYRKGLKTLITNMDAKVDNEIFEAGASYRLTIYHLFFSKIIINIITVALFASVLVLVICIVARELRIYAPIIVKVSGLVASVFIILLIFRSVFWKKFKK